MAAIDRSQRLRDPGAGRLAFKQLSAAMAAGGGARARRGGSRVDKLTSEDTPKEPTPAAKGSPRVDAGGDNSIRTTSRMVMLVVPETTKDDGAAAAGEEGGAPPVGSPPGTRRGHLLVTAVRGPEDADVVLTTKVASLTDLCATYVLDEKKGKEHQAGNTRPGARREAN